MTDDYCRAENCEYRHWRSGSMPTHRIGDTCPPQPGRVAHTGPGHAYGDPAWCEGCKAEASDRRTTRTDTT